MSRYFQVKLDFQYQAIQDQRNNNTPKQPKFFSVMPWNRFGDNEVHQYVVSYNADSPTDIRDKVPPSPKVSAHFRDLKYTYPDDLRFALVYAAMRGHISELQAFIGQVFEATASDTLFDDLALMDQPYRQFLIEVVGNNKPAQLRFYLEGQMVYLIIPCFVAGMIYDGYAGQVIAFLDWILENVPNLQRRIDQEPQTKFDFYRLAAIMAGHMVEESGAKELLLKLHTGGRVDFAGLAGAVIGQCPSLYVNPTLPMLAKLAPNIEQALGLPQLGQDITLDNPDVKKRICARWVDAYFALLDFRQGEFKFYS
ncbi:hypothetical protein H4R34_003244 [Dimargaris verticillata]|uniref:Uncharacterized protein n=1 Tax=Dimargaris verticillata TaxID=2761393 RepID=A0A9W8B171_9FUNG|nr:hypothetical protein H4R34_003244 [Dimargaris verticillata]